jgi:hypothetical protein
MSISPQAWLAAQGFLANPFEIWQADEEELLDRYFVRPTIFDEVRGDPTAQQSVVTFAPRGHGKSALRRQIGHSCANDPQHPALVVEVTNYDWANQDRHPPTNREDYRKVLTRLATQQLWAELARFKQRMESLEHYPFELVHFYALTEWSAQRSIERPGQLELAAEAIQLVSDRLRIVPPADASGLISHLVHEYQEIQIVQTLNDLVAICKAADYYSLLFLVDRVDEDEHTESNWDAALDLIKPLFNQHLLEIRHLAFKFFLPDAMFVTIREREVAPRLGNRPRRSDLTWNIEQLVAILRSRLEVFSRDQRGFALIRSFAEICEQIPDADMQLAHAAEGSPRRLIRLARMVMRAHCDNTDNADTLIPIETFSATLIAGRAAMAQEKAEFAPVPISKIDSVQEDNQATSTLLDTAQDSADDQLPPPIRLDADGTIWFGEQRHQGEISPLCRRIFEQLWDQRVRYLKHQELAETLNIDEESLYKAVVRLREQLEPELKNSKHYVDSVRGVGYRLANFVDEASTRMLHGTSMTKATMYSKLTTGNCRENHVPDNQVTCLPNVKVKTMAQEHNALRPHPRRRVRNTLEQHIDVLLQGLPIAKRVINVHSITGVGKTWLGYMIFAETPLPDTAMALWISFEQTADRPLPEVTPASPIHKLRQGELNDQEQFLPFISRIKEY